MKTLFAAFFELAVCLACFADQTTYYVRFYVDTGEKSAYSEDFPAQYMTLSFADDTFTAPPDPSRRQKVFSTRHDPSTRSNITEFPDAQILALDAVTDIRIKAAKMAMAESNIVSIATANGFTNLDWTAMLAYDEQVCATNEAAGNKLFRQMVGSFLLYTGNGGDPQRIGKGKAK
jgi:hypothetical protein